MIHWRHDGPTVWLHLDAPPCNEIGTAMLAALEGFLVELPKLEARTLVLVSDVPAGFCAGAHLRELYEGMVARPAQARDEVSDFLDRIHAVMNTLDMLPMTTVGVVHGVCFGGGFELALTCDVLIAEKSARFAFPELRLGLIPGFGGIPRLRRDVGNALIRDLLLTGRSINARRAQAAGLVSQVVNREEGRRAAAALAAQGARVDADAQRTAKAFAKRLPASELEEEKAHFLRLFENDAVREGLRTFYESDDVRPYLA